MNFAIPYIIGGAKKKWQNFAIFACLASKSLLFKRGRQQWGGLQSKGGLMANAAQIYAFFNKAQGWQKNLAGGWQNGGWVAYMAQGQLCLCPPIAKRLARKPEGWLGFIASYSIAGIKIANGQLSLPAAFGSRNISPWLGPWQA